MYALLKPVFDVSLAKKGILPSKLVLDIPVITRNFVQENFRFFNSGACVEVGEAQKKSVLRGGFLSVLRLLFSLAD